MSQPIDWKATGYLAGTVLVVLGAIKKMVTPFAVGQVRDAMQPEFDKIHKRVDEIAKDVAGLRELQKNLEVQNAYLRGKADQ